MLQKKDPLNLTGKVAVITGGSSGIGLGVCELLSAYGAKIAMVDISPKGEEKAKELRDAGREAAFFQCDVTNEEQVKKDGGRHRCQIRQDRYPAQQRGRYRKKDHCGPYREGMGFRS